MPGCANWQWNVEISRNFVISIWYVKQELLLIHNMYLRLWDGTPCAQGRQHKVERKARVERDATYGHHYNCYIFVYVVIIHAKVTGLMHNYKYLEELTKRGVFSWQYKEYELGDVEVQLQSKHDRGEAFTGESCVKSFLRKSCVFLQPWSRIQIGKGRG